MPSTRETGALARNSSVPAQVSQGARSGRPKCSKAAARRPGSNGLLRQPARMDLAVGILGRAGDEGVDVAILSPRRVSTLSAKRLEYLLARGPRCRRRAPPGRWRGRGRAPAPVAGERRRWRGRSAISSRPRNQVLHRRHREGGVLGQHRDDRLDVAALPGVDVALDDLAHAVVAERAQRRLLALLGQCAPRPSARARCRALLTEAALVSSVSAASLAEKPSTSRRISTARWLAGRCWRAATKASSTLSRCS